MINLKNEIEKLKNRGGWTNDEFYHCGVNDCLRMLDQYNIITAPKSIKLSEIVKRLEEEQTDYEFRYKEGSISVWKNRWCYAVLGIEDDTLKLDFDIHDRYLFPKWVFAMWIAGTEIIDDMEEE